MFLGLSVRRYRLLVAVVVAVAEEDAVA